MTRDRMSLFHHIWVSSGCPQEGVTYQSYKDARKAYKKTCQTAFNNVTEERFKLIERLAAKNKPLCMWNIVRKTRKSAPPLNAVSTGELEQHFRHKFASPNKSTKVIKDSKAIVELKFKRCSDKIYQHSVITQYQIKKYIKLLKSGCTPGVDGISTEHLKYGINTVLPNILSHLFTICAQFGVIPDSFAKGILIPILKKPNSDPTDPGNYHPITVSVTLSKFFETHIMDICSSYKFSSSQYVFISGRGGGQDVALAHDLGAFAVASGSTMFYCSLDAQGAFDFLPHTVLLNKAICFYRWYNKMCVYTRWNAIIGNEIKVNRGTRQGGLTSPFMFNLFYKDLIQNLNKMNHGITISGYNFNAICYADDILLCSVTSSGLQKLIDDADFNINNMDYNLIQAKRIVCCLEIPPYKNIPKWYMNNQPLNVVPSIKYLGTILEPGNGGNIQDLARWLHKEPSIALNVLV